MTTITVKIPRQKEIQAAYQKAPKMMREELAGAIARSTIRVEAQALQEAPIDTGMLRGRMTRTITPTQGEVFTTVKYAKAVHEGTRPRTITPKKKKMLAWKKNGQWHFAKKVRHPGIKANPFFTRALTKTRNEIEGEFVKSTNKVLQFIAKS